MKLFTQCAAALLMTATFALTGCASEDDDTILSDTSEDGDEIVATSYDELATSGQAYEANTQLQTIADLNLRRGAGTSNSVVRVIPNGSRVVVVSRSGTNAWVNVRFDGYTGWAHTSYLVELSPSGSTAGGGGSAPSGYNATRGNRLAQTALRVNGRRSQGYCAREVSNSVERSGILGRVSWRRNHAWRMANGMANDASYLAATGFARQSIGTRQAPKGSIIGWRPSQCGYNSTYGHIEIIANDSSLACSDYCATVKTCAAGAVFVTTTPR